MDKRILAVVGALGTCWMAALTYAQSAGTVSLSVSPSTGQGSVTPRLTWSTNPVATSCQASGGWSGTKAASGSQTLSAVNANTNYTLTCTWGVGSATVTWNAPTTNENGSRLTNLARFRVLYGTSSSSLSRSLTVDDPTRSSATVGSLGAGTWYFAVRAVNTAGVESANSNIASRSITGATASRTVSVTVTSPTPTPTPPPSGSLVTVATNVWDYYVRSDGVRVRIGVVGQIPLGRPCNPGFKVAASHYEVNRKEVKFTSKPRSWRVVTKCEIR
jgi:hypothetical protein